MDQLRSSLALAYIEDVDLLTTVSCMLHDYCRFAWVVHDIHYVCPTTACTYTLIPSSPCHAQILSRSRGEKSGEGLGTLLCHRPQMVDSVST